MQSFIGANTIIILNFFIEMDAETYSVADGLSKRETMHTMSSMHTPTTQMIVYVCKIPTQSELRMERKVNRMEFNFSKNDE